LTKQYSYDSIVVGTFLHSILEIHSKTRFPLRLKVNLPSNDFEEEEYETFFL